MVKNHLKSLSSPKTWHINRKKNVYITKPNPSSQKLMFTVSINHVFKNILKYCKTTKEVKKVLHENEVLIDGKRTKDHRESLGFMSVLSILSTKEYHRLLLNHRGKLELKKIDKDESESKPSVIKNKIVLGKDKIQLNMYDGRNILIKKNGYKTGDSLVILLPSQKIKEHIRLDKGTIIFLTGGKQIGSAGSVEEIKGDTVIFKKNDKEIYETKTKYAFPIGMKKPVISLFK